MKTATTINTITVGQIARLRSEALVVGDRKMVAICDRALDGRKPAIVKCVAAIVAGQG